MLETTVIGRSGELDKAASIEEEVLSEAERSGEGEALTLCRVLSY
jgi:hypothetical protein